MRQLKNEPESDVSDHMSKFTENNENSLDLVDVESKIKKEEIESPTKTIFNHFHKAGSLSKTGYLSVGFKHKKYEGSGNMTCQMLRSASNWSIGLKKQDYECSILLGYLALISGAENFIYIENQFFISRVTTENNNNPVKNMIAEALYLRIKKAVSEKKEFKIIVVMPLLPGFEGEITDPNAALLKIQLHYEYQTISRGGKSLLEMLSKDQEIDDPTKYISFYGLRNHCIMDGKPVTEIIYVHSKLMIVDDKYVIMGSANINDRSMLGKRDSEIAVLKLFFMFFNNYR